MEEQEEKEGNSLIANVVQLITWSYFNPNPTRQIDTTFAAGLLSAVSAQFGLNIKKGSKGNNSNNVKAPKIVDNKDTNVGIK